MKLHLPPTLRKALLATFVSATAFVVSTSAASASTASVTPPGADASYNVRSVTTATITTENLGTVEGEKTLSPGDGTTGAAYTADANNHFKGDSDAMIRNTANGNAWIQNIELGWNEFVGTYLVDGGSMTLSNVQGGSGNAVKIQIGEDSTQQNNGTLVFLNGTSLTASGLTMQTNTVLTLTGSGDSLSLSGNASMSGNSTIGGDGILTLQDGSSLTMTGGSNSLGDVVVAAGTSGSSLAVAGTNNSIADLSVTGVGTANITLGENGGIGNLSIKDLSVSSTGGLVLSGRGNMSVGQALLDTVISSTGITLNINSLVIGNSDAIKDVSKINLTSSDGRSSLILNSSLNTSSPRLGLSNDMTVLNLGGSALAGYADSGLSDLFDSSYSWDGKTIALAPTGNITKSQVLGLIDQIGAMGASLDTTMPSVLASMVYTMPFTGNSYLTKNDGSGTAMLINDQSGFTGTYNIQQGSLLFVDPGFTGTVKSLEQSGQIVLADNTTATFNISDGNTLTQKGVISGTGSIIKQGGGILRVLTTDNPFQTTAGDITIDGGTLKILTNDGGNSSILGADGATDKVVINNGGTLEIGVQGGKHQNLINRQVVLNSGSTLYYVDGVNGAEKSLWFKQGISVNGEASFKIGSDKAVQVSKLSGNGTLNIKALNNWSGQRWFNLEGEGDFNGTINIQARAFASATEWSYPIGLVLHSENAAVLATVNLEGYDANSQAKLVLKSDVGRINALTGNEYGLVSSESTSRTLTVSSGDYSGQFSNINITKVDGDDILTLSNSNANGNVNALDIQNGTVNYAAPGVGSIAMGSDGSATLNLTAGNLVNRGTLAVSANGGTINLDSHILTVFGAVSGEGVLNLIGTDTSTAVFVNGSSDYSGGVYLKDSANLELRATFGKSGNTINVGEGSHTIIFKANQTNSSIVMGSGTNLTLDVRDGNHGWGGLITNDGGTLTISSQGSKNIFLYGNNSSLGELVLETNANIGLSAGMTLSASSVSGSGTQILTIQSNATFNVIGSVDVNSLVLAGGSANKITAASITTGTLTMSNASGIVDATGNITFNGWANNGQGTIQSTGGNITANAAVGSTNSLTLNANGELNLTKGGTLSAATLKAGMLNVGTDDAGNRTTLALSGTSTIAADATNIRKGETLSIATSVDNKLGSLDIAENGILKMTDGAQATTATGISTASTNPQNVTNAGQINLAGQNTKLTAGNITGLGGITLDDKAELDAASVELSGTTSITGGSSVNSTGAVNLSGQTTITDSSLQGSSITLADVTVIDDVTGGTSLNAGTGVLQIGKGEVTLDAAGSSISAGSVVIGTDAAVTLAAGTMSLGDITINKSGQLVVGMNLGSNDKSVTNAGNLSVELGKILTVSALASTGTAVIGGAVSAVNDIALSGSVSLNGGSLTSSAGGITLSDVSSMDEATITASDATSGTVTFTGTQNMSGTDVILTAQNLTIGDGVNAINVNFGNTAAGEQDFGQVTIAGTTTINANAELSLHNHKTASNPDSLGAIVNDGKLRIVNTDATAVSWNGNGTLELGYGGAYFGNLTLASTEEQTINGLVSLKGTGGTLKAGGDLVLKSVLVEANSPSNLIEAAGNLTVNRIASTASSLATFKGANVTVDVSSADSKTFRGITLTAATDQQGKVTLNDVVSQGGNSVTATYLIVDGTTTLTDADALNLTTGTTINSGASLTLDDGAASDTLALNVVNQQGTLAVQANVTATATSLTDTAGSFTIVGGTLTVTNAMTVIGNLFVGGNLVSANGLTATGKTIGGTGTLTVGDHLSLGSGSFGGYVVLSSGTSVDGSLGTIDTANHKLTIGGSTTMTLTGAGASTINGGLDGNGTLALTGEGTVNYTGPGSFAGIVNVSNGILNIGDGSTTTKLGELAGMNLSGDGAVNVNANLTTGALSMEGSSKLNVSGSGVSMVLNQGDGGSTALTADQLSVTDGASFIAQGTLSIENSSETVVQSNGTIQAKNLTISGKTAGVDADNKLNLKGTELLTVSGNDSLSLSVLTTGTDGSSGTLILDKVTSDGTNTLNTKALVIAGGTSDTDIHTTELKDTDVLTLAGTSTSTTINQHGELFITDGDTAPSVSTINLDAITNNGLLTIDHDVAAQAASIAGTGTLTINAKDTAAGSLNGMLTVTGKVMLGTNGTVVLNGDLLAQGGFESTDAANFHGTGNLKVAQTYKMVAGDNNDFSGTVVLIGDTTAEGRAPQIDTADKTLTIETGKTFAIDLADSTSTIGSLAGSGTLQMDAKGGTLNLTAVGGFTGTLTQNDGTIQITAGTLGSSSFGTLTAIDINGGWMEVATDIETAQLTVDGEPNFIDGFLSIGNNATLTVSGNVDTTLNGMLGLGFGDLEQPGNLTVTNSNLTVNNLDDGAYGTLDVSGHTLTVSGITTGLGESKRLTMNAKNIVLKPTSTSTGFQYVDATATDGLTFSLNTSKVDVSDSTISAVTLLVNGLNVNNYVQIMDSVLTLTTGTTVNQATLAFSKSAAVGTQTSYDLKAVTLQNGGNLVVNGSQLTFTTWSDAGNTGTVYLSAGSLSQVQGFEGDITINSKVDGKNLFGSVNPEGNGTLAVNSNLTLAGSGNELDGDTVQSAKTLTLQGSYTTLSGSSLLGEAIVLDSSALSGTGLKLMQNADGDKNTSLTVSKSATLAGSYINTAKTTIASGQKLTLDGSYVNPSIRTIEDGTASELGEITLSETGGNELALINGAQANFKSYSDQDTSALTITDSTLTQSETSGSGITVKGTTTITNTADNLQASLDTIDNLTLAGDNTITGIDGGEKALVSTDGDLIVGSDGHTNAISDAALSAGNKTDDKTFTLAGTTATLSGNSIDAQNIVFSSTGEAEVSVKSLIDGLTASYSNTVAGTDNALSGTNLTVNKATQLSGGSLNLTGNVTTVINNGAMLQLDNVTLDGTPGSVVELGLISVKGEENLTTLSITGGTQAHGSSLAMTGNSFLSIDGTDGKLNTTLTLDTSDVLTQSTFSGISVANNGHLVFKTGDITITEDNKDKIKWDASSEIRTEAGDIVFDGVKDDFFGDPVRGEIVTEGNFDVELINGAQIYATGVSTHNLNLHDDATKLKIAISDQGGATWSKMEIRDTLSLTNGADLAIANVSNGIDLGTLGILAVKGNSNVSLTGQADSDDFFTTKTITLTDSAMNVEDLALNAVNDSVSVILRGASELTLNRATLADYDVLSLAGASSASLSGVTLEDVGGINMNSTGTLAFTGINDLGTAAVTMTSGSASIIGQTTGSFALAGGSGLTIGGVDSGELIGQVDFHGGTLFIANLGDSSGLLLNTGIGGNGTVFLADGQKLALEADSLTGSGTLTVTGQGALTVNGTQSTFSSNVNYGAGTLTLGAENALGTGMLTLANDTTDMVVSGSQANTLSFIGKTLNLASDGTVEWKGNVTGGQLNVTGGATTLAGPVMLSTLTADGIAVQLTNIGAEALNANDIDSLVSTNRGSISNALAAGKGYYGSYGSLTVTDDSSITLHDAAVKGAINAENGAITLEDTAANLGFNDITVSGSGELSIDGGTLSTGGDLTGNGSVVLTDLAANVGSVDFDGSLELGNAGITATSDIDLTNAALTVTNDGGALTSSEGDMDLGAVTAQYLKLTANYGVLTFNGATDLTGSVVNAGTLDVKAATTLTGSLLNVASETILDASLTLTGGKGTHELGTTIGNSGGLTVGEGASAAGGTLSGDGALTVTGELNLRETAIVSGETQITGHLTAAGDIHLGDVASISGRVESSSGSVGLNGDGKSLTGAVVEAAGDLFILGSNAALGNGNLVLTAGKNLGVAEGLTDSTGTTAVFVKGMDVDLGATTLTSARTDLEVGGTLSVDENLTIGKLANGSSLGNVVTSGDSALSLKGEDGMVTATGLTLGGASVRLESMDMDLGTAGVAALNGGTLDLVGMSLSGQSMTTAAGTTLTLGTNDSTMNTSRIDLTGDFTANGAVAFYDGSIIKAHTVTFNGTVTGDMGIESGTDIYLNHVNGVLNLKAGRTIDITNGDTLAAGSSLKAVNLAVHGADALTATDTSFSISGTTTIDRAGALNLVWTSARTTDSLGAVTVSEGTFSATGAEGTELTVNGITAGGGSTTSLNNLTLNGGISTVADEQLDTVSLTSATVMGNITVNGGDVMNMTTSAVKGTVLLNGSTLNVLATGENSIDTLTLAYDARVNINQGATLNVDTTGIGTGSDMQINGTVTGNVTLMGGTATLASTGIVDGNLGIQGGTLSYGGGTVNGDLSFLADPVGNSVINLGSSWTLASGKALAVDGNGTINMGSNSMTSHGLTGNGDLTLTGSGTFTFDKTGTHTGNIILKDSVSIAASGENYGMGTSGSLIAESGEHTITIGRDQSKGLVINKGSTVNLVNTRDLEWQGLINNQGTLNISVQVSPLYLSQSGSDLGNLNLTQGTVALSHWNSSPHLDIRANDITGSADTIFDLKASSLTANSMNLLGTLKGSNNSQLILANGLKTASMELTGTTVSARSIQANATSLGNNSKLTATEDLTLSDITNIGNDVSLAGGNVSLSSAVTLTSGNLSLTAGHKLLLNSGTYIWTNSTVDVHDSTTLAEGVSLTLDGGSQSLGTLNGSTNSTIALTGGANAQAATILFAEGSIMLDGASSLSTTTAADSTISSLTLAGGSSLETAGDLEITTLEDEANGSIISDGDLTIDNDITTSDTLSLIAGGTLTLQGDSSTINGDDSLLAGETISVDGDLTMNGANASIEAIGEISLNNITMTGEGSSITTGGTLAISGSGNLEHTTIETGTLHLVEDGDGTTMKDVSLTAAHTIVDAGKMLRLMAGNEYSLGITSITGDLNLGGNNEAANAATVTAESMSIGYSFDAKGRQIDGTLTVNTGSSLTVRHSLTSTGSTSIVGSVTAGTIVLSGNANDLSGYGTVDGGTLKSLSSMTITNATLGRTTLSSVTNMSIAGTLTDGGHNTLTSSEGNITLNASMTGADNTVSAANGTVDINAAISGDGLNVTAQDLVIDAALTTAGDYAGRGEITVAGTMDVNAAATLANVTLNVARTDITGSGSSLTVSNTGAFGKLGNVTVADHGSLTLTGTTAGTASSLTADISVSNNSTASLANTALAGSILVSADANTLTLAQTSVTGNVTLLGTTNTLSMTDSTIGQTLTMDGGQFDLYGANTVGELLLNTTNINLTLHDGATLNAVGKETVIDKNGLYRIEGTHTGSIRIANGTVDLGSEDYAGMLDGALALAYGTLNYNNADSAISAGNAITLTGESGFARNINVNADWDASGNSLVANADGVINLASNLTLGSIASGSGTITVNPTDRPRFLTLNETGEHTGDIVLNSSSDYIKSAGASSFKSVMLLTLNAANALGTDGALKVIGDNRLVLADGADQDKKIQLSGDGTDSLIVNVNNEDEATLYGTVTTGDGDMIVKIGSGTLNLEGIANTVHNLGVYEGIVNAPGSDGTVQVINKFGNLLVGGSEDGNSTLNLGYATLMGGSLIQADTNGTIRLDNVLGTSVGNVLTLDNGAITVNESDLSVNSVKNEGTFETTGTILNVTNGLHNMGAMTLKGNSTVNAGELVSSGDLNIGDGTDATKVGIVRDAALSGTTTIGSGSSLAAGQTVTVTGQTTVNGALSGKDIALNGSDAVVSGHDGRIEADRNLNAGSGSDLVMNGNSSVSAGNDMNLEGLVSVDGSLAAGNNLNVTGDGTTLEGTVTVNGNTTVGGSLTVTDGDVTLNGTANVTDKTTVNGNGSLTLDSTGAGDLGNVTVNDDGSLTVNGNGNSVNADNITMNGNASGSISDTVLNLNGGRGEIILNDASSLDIANTTVNGSISTTNTSSTDSTHLGLDKVDINGDLTVVGGDLVLSNDNTVSGSLNISDTVNVTVNDENGNPGTLVVKEGTLIDPNASLTIDEKSNFTSNVTMTGGSFTVNGNAEGNNFNGAISFQPNDNLAYPGASSPVVTINGTHNQNMGITVDADASINVNGTLNINGTLSSGSNGDDTLSLNANGETGEIVINSTNEGFEDDIAIGGGTLVVNANEAIGKDGTLSVTGEGVTLKNTADGATVSKDIATNGNGLTIQTDQDFILAGQINAAGDTIVKSGDADLVLSHDPILNDAPSIIGTLDQTAGDVTIDGTDYTVGNLHIAAGDLNFTSLGGNTIHNVTVGEGSSITLTGANAATNGSSADILGNSETNEGAVELDGATLETDGTIVGLDTLMVGTSAKGVGSSATLANSAGTITSTTVEIGSELTLIDSAIEGTSLATSGTTNVTDTELTLDEAIYVRDGGILNLDGASVIDSDIVLSNGTVNILEGSSSVITADSTLDFNEGMLRSAGDRLVNVHENFTMEGTVRMTSDGTVMVDADKTMNVNGGFDGDGELHKTGNGTLAFNKADAAYTGTVNLKEGTIDATASNAYGSSSTLNIAGSGVTLQTGVRDGDPVRFDSALTVDGDHAFTVNTLADTAWNGQLAGAKGAMTKTGNATLAINNANSQGFATAIKVNEGDLALNGNIGSNVTLARGTMLSGNGSTTGHVDARNDNTVIEIGEAGKMWNGHTGGVETLTLGSAAFERSEADCMGVYKTGTKTIVDLDLANNASDKLVVTGKADLNNSLVEIRKGAYTPTQERGVADGTRFHIVDAGELTGTFHDEVQHDLYLLNAHLENTATGTDLVLSVNHKGADKHQNQSGISGVIESIDNDGIATGELLDMINAFKHTRSEAEAKAALDSVGGTRLSTMMSSMLAGNVNHLRNLRNSMGTGSYAISVTPDAKGGMISHGRSNTEVWVTPTAGYNKANGDSNAPGFSRSSWGAMMGAERSLDANTMLGISLGYDYARTEVLGATDETDTYNIDLYGTYRNGAWQNRASLGIGFHDFTNDRFVTVGDRFAHMSRGAASGTSLNFAYELSYTFQLDAKSTIAPLFTVESSLGWIGSYSEKGDIGNAALHLDRQDAWATILGLGGRYTRDFSVISSAPSARFEAMALMTFDVGDQGAPLTASFMGAPGRNFTVNPAANNRIGALIGAGVTVPFNERLSAFGGTNFEFRSGTRDFTANVGVRYTF